MLGPGQPQYIGFGGVTVHGDQAGGRGVLEGASIGVDDDDLALGGLITDPGGDGRFALGAVADHDGVVAHFVPPTLNLPCLPGSLGEHLERRADQHGQERDPQRREDHGVHQTRGFGVRGDVAVAGRRQRHRREVDAVQECRRLAPHIAVAIAIQIDNDGGGE